MLTVIQITVLVLIKYRQEVSKYKRTRGTRQRKFDIKKLKDMEIVRMYKEKIRKGIAENSE